MSDTQGPQPEQVPEPEPVAVAIHPPLAEQVKEILPELSAAVGAAGNTPDNPVSVAATTTAEEDRSSEGQRRINYTWEYTQAGIAIFVVISTVTYMFATLWIKPSNTTAEMFFSSAFTLIVGFYFGRSNHARPSGRAGSQNTIETVWDFRDNVTNK